MLVVRDLRLIFPASASLVRLRSCQETSCGLPGTDTPLMSSRCRFRCIHRTRRVRDEPTSANKGAAPNADMAPWLPFMRPAGRLVELGSLNGSEREVDENATTHNSDCR